MKSIVAGSVMGKVTLAESSPKALDEALAALRSETEHALGKFEGHEIRVRLVLTVDSPPYELG